MKLPRDDLEKYSLSFFSQSPIWTYLIICEKQMGLLALMGLVLKSNACSVVEKLRHCRENLSSHLLPGFQIHRGFWEQPDGNSWVTSQRMIKGWIKTHEAKLCSWLLLWGHAKASPCRALWTESNLLCLRCQVHSSWFCTKSCETVGLKWGLKPEVKSLNIWGFRSLCVCGFVVFVAVWIVYICLRLKY